MKVRVDVTLKDGVLDPQGKAVGRALESLGFTGLGDVRVGKTIEMDVAETSAAEACEQAKVMAEKLLANPVIEDFRVHIVEA